MHSPLPVSPPVASSEATGVLRSRRARRRVLAATIGLFTTACGDTPCIDRGLFVFRLPESMAVLACVAVALVLAGVAIEPFVALHVLHTADATITRHHRATLARVFAASRDLHAAVEDNIRRAHRR